MKEIKTEKAPKPVGPYSQAVLVENFLFLSGQIGIDPKNGKLVPGLKNQVRQIFKNVEAILQEAGFSKKNIAKVVVYMVDLTRFGELNEVYEEFFSDVEVKPARVTVGVKELPLCAEVEIEVIAVRE